MFSASADKRADRILPKALTMIQSHKCMTADFQYKSWENRRAYHVTGKIYLVKPNIMLVRFLTLRLEDAEAPDLVGGF